MKSTFFLSRRPQIKAPGHPLRQPLIFETFIS